MRDFFYPQTVAEVKSKINGLIRVSKYRGQYSLWVGGFEQSGPVYVAKVWKKALEKVSGTPKTALILGLGGGTLVGLLTQNWPNTKITGVEIDPVMIALGKKYFGLGEYKNLKIIRADARKYRPTRPFDLVLADAYLGNKKVSRENLKKLGKVVLSNSLRGTKNAVELV
ncbi:class I SAM-dependent methyltransferase [Candidatus Microgenomates bacterium]|nr:class I SAM-dependent methyltransferase [Candidatus Microgenomates bacterium]